MNIGYEDDDLKPYIEPTADISDHIRIGNTRVGAFLCQTLQISCLQPHQCLSGLEQLSGCLVTKTWKWKSFLCLVFNVLVPLGLLLIPSACETMSCRGADTCGVLVSDCLLVFSSEMCCPFFQIVDVILFLDF